MFKIYKGKYSAYDPSILRRDKLCEISRLTILSEYRTSRSTDPIKRLVTLALPLCAYVVGEHYDMIYAYQYCAPPMVRYLSKALGSPLTPIGEPFEYHGTRIPTGLHGPSSILSFDLIPYTFFRLLKRHLFGPTMNVSTEDPVQSPTARQPESLCKLWTHQKFESHFLFDNTLKKTSDDLRKEKKNIWKSISWI